MSQNVWSMGLYIDQLLEKEFTTNTHFSIRIPIQ